jgi:hypothetical protein
MLKADPEYSLIPTQQLTQQQHANRAAEAAAGKIHDQTEYSRVFSWNAFLDSEGQ